MQTKATIIAYIDEANLHKGAKSIGLDLDYRRLRTWLGFKYGVTEAFIFIGMVAEYSSLYNRLQQAGFKLVFKEVVFDGDGKAKGNCDADLVLHIARDVYEKDIQSAVLVSSDGDYASTMRFLLEKGKDPVILSPSVVKKCSLLLKRTGARIAYLNDFASTLARRGEADMKKPPSRYNP
jgi:uncharacterized LabA/DUF88 family protein